MTPEAAMLKTGNLFIIIVMLLIVSCTNLSENDLKTVSTRTIGLGEYRHIYNASKDSLDMWSKNKLGLYSNEKDNYEYELDSLLCFNQEASRFITCILEKIKGHTASDGIKYFYGEKISNKWYFFGGSSLVIPRENNGSTQPLSYSQLHQIALHEVYSGYLNSTGSINEDWFTQHFEGPGWGFFDNQSAFDWFLKGKRFTNKKGYFEYVHKQASIAIWASRDTTQPIKRLENKPLP